MGVPDPGAVEVDRGAGAVGPRAEPVQVLEGQPTTGVVLKMVRQRIVKGRVTSVTGSPLKDAQVLVLRTQSRGGDNPDLPHVGAVQADGAAREVYLYFISAAKHRNPAAAMALTERLRGG